MRDDSAGSPQYPPFCILFIHSNVDRRKEKRKEATPNDDSTIQLIQSLSFQPTTNKPPHFHSHPFHIITTLLHSFQLFSIPEHSSHPTNPFPFNSFTNRQFCDSSFFSLLFVWYHSSGLYSNEMEGIGCEW